MIEMDLNKKQALDADPKAIQEIDFTENLDRPENAWLRSKRNRFGFFSRNSGSVVNLFRFNIILI